MRVLSWFPVVSVVLCATFVLHIQCKMTANSWSFPPFIYLPVSPGNCHAPRCQNLLGLLQASRLLQPLSCSLSSFAPEVCGSVWVYLSCWESSFSGRMAIVFPGRGSMVSGQARGLWSQALPPGSACCHCRLCDFGLLT